MLHMQFEIPGAFPPLKDGHGQKQILPPICHRKKIWIYKNRMPYSKSHLKQQRSQKKWTQVAQFLEIFSQKIILTQPAMVSLWALHGTGRELLLSSTSLQDFWLENISSAQYFKISVQPSLSHLSHFEEKSPLVLWQELRSTGSPQVSQDRAPVNTQPVFELPVFPELLVRHCRASKGAARQHQKTLQVNLSHVCSCQSAQTCSK